jgi:hypothetical protein
MHYNWPWTTSTTLVSYNEVFPAPLDGLTSAARLTTGVFANGLYQQFRPENTGSFNTLSFALVKVNYGAVSISTGNGGWVPYVGSSLYLPEEAITKTLGQWEVISTPNGIDIDYQEHVAGQPIQANNTIIYSAGAVGVGVDCYVAQVATYDVSFDVFRQLTQEFVGDDEAAPSLLAKINAAQSAATRGNTHAVRSILAAYQQELRSENRRNLSPDMFQRAVLVRMADALL